jgi:hypothetical protein
MIIQLKVCFRDPMDHCVWQSGSCYKVLYSLVLLAAPSMASKGCTKEA